MQAKYEPTNDGRYLIFLEKEGKPREDFTVSARVHASTRFSALLLQILKRACELARFLASLVFKMRDQIQVSRVAANAVLARMIYLLFAWNVPMKMHKHDDMNRNRLAV